MMKNKRILPLDGINIPLDSMLDSFNSIHSHAQRDLMRHTCDTKSGRIAPPNSVFCNGKTGEFEYLDASKQLEVLKIAVQELNWLNMTNGTNIYVLNGAHIRAQDAKVETSMDLTIDHALQSIYKGADGIVFGFAHFLEDEGQIDGFMSKLEDVMENQGVTFPVYMYNNPALHFGYNISPEAARQFAMRPFSAGLKDSSGNIDLTVEYHKACRRLEPPTFKISIGNEAEMTLAKESGITSAVPSMGNVMPGFVNSYYLSDDMEKAQRQMDGFKRIFYFNGEPKYAIHGMKTALAMIGIGELDDKGNPHVSDRRLLYQPEASDKERFENQKMMMRNALEKNGYLKG